MGAIDRVGLVRRLRRSHLARFDQERLSRGRVVVRDGLCGRVRYPMYLGIIQLFCGLPLVLSSWYSYIPSMVIVCLFVYRTR